MEGAPENTDKPDGRLQADAGLAMMSREQLIEEVVKLRAGIREHRDASGHDLCWHHPKLWNLLPEKTDPEVLVPAWPEFITRCAAYRKSLDQLT